MQRRTPSGHSCTAVRPGLVSRSSANPVTKASRRGPISRTAGPPHLRRISPAPWKCGKPLGALERSGDLGVRVPARTPRTTFCRVGPRPLKRSSRPSRPPQPPSSPSLRCPSMPGSSRLDSAAAAPPPPPGGAAAAVSLSGGHRGRETGRKRRQGPPRALRSVQDGQSRGGSPHRGSNALRGDFWPFFGRSGGTSGRVRAVGWPLTADLGLPRGRGTPGNSGSMEDHAAVTCPRGASGRTAPTPARPP